MMGTLSSTLLQANNRTLSTADMWRFSSSWQLDSLCVIKGRKHSKLTIPLEWCHELTTVITYSFAAEKKHLLYSTLWNKWWALEFDCIQSQGHFRGQVRPDTDAGSLVLDHKTPPQFIPKILGGAPSLQNTIPLFHSLFFWDVLPL